MRKDWAAIRGEYVTGEIGLRALAEKYHVSLSTLAVHAAREDWVEEREKEREKILRSAQARSREKRIKREAVALERLTGLSEAIIDAIDRALEDPEQLYRHVIYVGKGTQGEEVLAKLDTKAARDYVAMISELQAVFTSAGGILDKKTAEDLKLKRARLNLDKQKAGLNQESEGDTGIALLPPVEETAETEVVVGDE